MRLTLRFLLAYLDNILEPPESEEIGKRIEESKQASDLMHRIQDCMRQRLAAPDVSDQGALDPNTVAEYLDHMLPAEGVQAFEKVCLESDVHLAEVASCHQVLALVLGEPAEVDAASRQRMYQLPQVVAARAKQATDRAEEAVEELVTGNGQSPAPAASDKVRRQKPSVPEYLRDDYLGQRRFWPTLFATVVVLFFVGGVGTLVWNLLNPPDGAGPEATELADASGQKQGAVVEPVAQPSVPPIEPKTKEAPKVAEGTPQPSQTTPPTPTEVPPTPSVGAKVDPPREGGEEVAMKPPAEPKVKQETEPATAPPAEPAPPVEPEPATPPQSATQQVIARLISTKEVLAKYDLQTQLWMRVGDQSELRSGERCLALPTYRPVLSLADQLRVQLVDGTQAELTANPDGTPVLALAFGRVVIQPMGEAATPIRLVVGEHTGVIRFADNQSIVAIQADRTAVSNADPETQPGPMALDLYATSGNFMWQVDANVSAKVAAGQRLTVPSAAPVAVEKFPAWVNQDTVSLLDLRAASTVEQQLKVNRPVSLTLRELTEHRQREVRWLAMRSLASIGDLELLVAALDNAEQKMQWQDEIDLLKTAVRRSPQSANEVRTAMEHLHGQAAGAGLYEMLWQYRGKGPSGQELEQADAARLVGFLEHPALAVRVLAFSNLKSITSLTFSYNPLDPANRREGPVRKWREHLRVEAAPPAASPLEPAMPPPAAPPEEKVE